MRVVPAERPVDLACLRPEVRPHRCIQILEVLEGMRAAEAHEADGSGGERVGG